MTKPVVLNKNRDQGFDVASIMHDSLIRYINHSTSPLNDSEVDAIKHIFVPKRLRKRQYFLQEGEVCKYNLAKENSS